MPPELLTQDAKSARWVLALAGVFLLLDLWALSEAWRALEVAKVVELGETPTAKKV